jgi:hypothetical protein
MKLFHAAEVVDKLLLSEAVSLSSTERVALTVLSRFAGRVVKARGSFRAVYRAMEGDDLNQDDLFPATIAGNQNRGGP